jgi:hypothetical protein
MNLIDFAIDLPADKQEAFKAMAQNAIVVSNREDAARFIAEHPHLKSERDAIISRTTDNYAIKFREEKLDGLVDEEYKKRNPPKDAKDQALADMQAKLAKMERDAILKDRKAVAMQKFTEAGLPADLADFALDEDENIFASKIERLSGGLSSWKEAAIKQALTGAVGNQKTPQGGQVGAVDFSNMNQTAIMQFASKGQAEKEAVTQWLATKK